MIAEPFEDAKARYAKVNAQSGGSAVVSGCILRPYWRDVLGLSPLEFAALDWETLQVELGYLDGKHLAAWVDRLPVDGKPHAETP